MPPDHTGVSLVSQMQSAISGMIDLRLAQNRDKGSKKQRCVSWDVGLT
jgi:hypothetical protein